MINDINVIFTGIIQFSERYSITLDEAAVFDSPSGVKVNLCSSDKKGEIEVEMIIAAPNIGAATAMAELEISRLANLLSWFRNIPVVEARVSGAHYSRVEGNKHTISIVETIGVSDSVSIQLGLSKEAVAILASKLAKNYDPAFEEALIMWREALKQDSNGLKFFLLFRLLEWLTGKERMDADKWIRVKDTTLPLEKGKNGKGDVSILTFLRDNVHAKSITFPFVEVERFLPKLQQLVKICIEEKYGCSM